MAADDRVDRFLGWRQVKDLTGLGRTTAWRMRVAGAFPEPVPISPSRVAWRERDIVAWNESRGPPIPAARSLKPPTRPQEGRLIEATPAPLKSDLSSSGVTRKPRPRRRRGPAVAEGQLGFDF